MTLSSTLPALVTASDVPAEPSQVQAAQEAVTLIDATFARIDALLTTVEQSSVRTNKIKLATARGDAALLRRILVPALQDDFQHVSERHQAGVPPDRGVALQSATRNAILTGELVGGSKDR